MATKLYDAEFAPGVLRMLKKRAILGRANAAQLACLNYNLGTEALAIAGRFQDERKRNPLLETTPPEAWIAAEVSPLIQEVRSNIDVDEELLSEAIQEYLRPWGPRNTGQTNGDEQKLHTTIEPYVPVLKKLLFDLYDRAKSLRAILGLRRHIYRVRDLVAQTRPSSRREGIMLQGIQQGWTNQRVARALDEAGITPRKHGHYDSYQQMLHISPQLFYSLKNQVKTKYRARLALALTP